MNKNPSPQFPLYAQDFLTGVTYLTNEEVGIYIKMICKQWTDGYIPKKRLGFLIGLDFDQLSDELKSKFIEKNGMLYNERLEHERDKRLKFKEKQSANGKKGGRPKKPKQNPNETQQQSQKKPLDNDNDNKCLDIDNNSFARELVKNKHEHQSYIEGLYMRHRIKKGQLGKLLAGYNLDLQVHEVNHKTLTEYKRHFANWLNKQEQMNKLQPHKI